ncbi:MAG: RnfABCDGE type electron transport complex subunit B [Synergistaceae bacterium]|jgi:Na+-translocating ferredoxin:NAD+ oxidoreductase RNF subunit RnfB|nr:RnfABCDGE type electron transport complex subunit B [Synergistaceae bacterium]
MISLSGVLYPVLILGALGLTFGALLGFASIKFFVKTDERVAKIREILPGANCGGCGYPGCDGYADGIVSEGAKTNLCAAGGAELARGIAEIMGVESEALVPVRAFLKCKGSPEFSKRNAIYEGIMDCRSAIVVPGGSPNACPFGCIGLGTCVKVCVFGAMSIVNGLASADPIKCIGCGTCVANCPKSVLTLIPRMSNVQAVCNSNWRGPDVKKVCSVGCIGCGLCAKTCPEGAIAVQNNLAAVDASKCVNCGKCVGKCPTKSIGYIIPVREDVRESA